MTEDKPLGVYIHIPFCKAKCKYCAFVSVADKGCERAYIAALIAEIKGSQSVGRAVDSVYIGGGTPSCLSRGAIDYIISAARDAFRLTRDCEITVEANPESCTASFAAECKAAGVNRISMGLQSADDKILRAIGRIHTVADYVKAAELLAANFDNISSDIILGLPEQTERDVRAAVELVTANCSHASVYALNVEEGTPLYARGYAPDDDRVADLYDTARALLAARGLKRYEVSNFAVSGRESRHNNKYWNCDEYAGFGVAAHGYDGEYIRYYHSDDIAEYIETRGVYVTKLTDKDRFNEYVMLRLRTERGIDERAFKARFGFDFAQTAGEKLARSVADGTIVSANGHIAIAHDKMFVMNGIIEELMLD